MEENVEKKERETKKKVRNQTKKGWVIRQVSKNQDKNETRGK